VPALPAVSADLARAPDTTGIAEPTVDGPSAPAAPGAAAQSAAIPMAEPSAADLVSPPVFQQTIREAIARLPWSRALRKHQDWTWKDQELRCPQGNLASFSGVILQGNRNYARFTIGAVYCFGCPLRAKCTKSANPGYARTINVPRADELPAGIRLGKNKTNAAWYEPALNQRLRPPASTPAGPCKMAAPLLVPTVLRDKLRKLSELTRVEVDAISVAHRMSSDLKLGSTPSVQHGAFAPNAKLRPLVVQAGAQAPRRRDKPQAGGHDCQMALSDAELAHHAVEQARRDSGRLGWAQAMRLAWKADVLQCNCGGRRKLVALIDQPSVVRRILAHLGLTTEALTKPEESIWRVRRPPDELFPGDLDDAGLPVEVDGVDEEPGEPFFDEVPVDDWAA
jgi:hypothetical protein